MHVYKANISQRTPKGMTVFFATIDLHDLTDEDEAKSRCRLIQNALATTYGPDAFRVDLTAWSIPIGHKVELG